MKTALITGINGQDGSYLSEFLLEKDYFVHGIIRRASVFNTERIDHLMDHPRFKLHYGDLTDSSNLLFLLSTIRPDEVYNLAAQSHVKVSFEMPEYTAEVDGVGTLRLLDALRATGLEKHTKFYQASTSEMYGKVKTWPQNEETPFHPRSPYGVAKVFAYWSTVNYREAYGMFAVNGILFNHESPRRGATFVTRKITRAVNSIVAGKQETLVLGNLDATRDWGHAKDYVRAMWMMLQQEEPKDFVVATGETHTVREFVEMAFRYKGVEIVWEGSGSSEKGKCKETGKVLVEVNERYFRPAEVERLLGDPSLCKKILGWTPEYSFTELVEEMVASDA